MSTSDINKSSGFSSTNMNLSEPVRFLVLIRVAFELVLVLLGIHNKLSSIADSIGKMDKERPTKC